MPDYTENEYDDSFSTRVRDSNNTSTTNSSTTVGVDLNGVGNTDSSTNDSGNIVADLDGVGNTDSNDTNTSVDGSYNDWSDNSVNDWSNNTVVDDSDNSTHDNSDNSVTDDSDNSINGSYNDGTSSLVEGSYNTYLDHSVDDHSIEVGTRDYSTGFGSLDLGGGAGGGGDVWVDNQNTIVDQSYNAGGGWGHGGEAGGTAVVASGDGSTAAGNDVNLSQYVDRSQNFSADGDVNIGNETHVITVTDSYNETVDESSWEDSSSHLYVDDSYNADSSSWTADNSFNDELTSHTENVWDVDADVIWGSEDALIVDTAGMDDAFDGS